MNNELYHYYGGSELYHYGVPGMKWGVKKSVYKQMSRKDRRAAKQKYIENQTKQNIKKHGKAGTIGREALKRVAIDRGLKLAQLGATTAGLNIAGRTDSFGGGIAALLGAHGVNGALNVARGVNAVKGAVNIGRTATSQYKRKPKYV